MINSTNTVSLTEKYFQRYCCDWLGDLGSFWSFGYLSNWHFVNELIGMLQICLDDCPLTQHTYTPCTECHNKPINNKLVISTSGTRGSGKAVKLKKKQILADPQKSNLYRFYTIYAMIWLWWWWWWWKWWQNDLLTCIMAGKNYKNIHSHVLITLHVLECVPLWHVLNLCPLYGGVTVCNSTLRLYIQYVHRLGRTSNTTAALKGQRYFMSQHW